jgi:hypothetical protein
MLKQAQNHKALSPALKELKEMLVGAGVAIEQSRNNSITAKLPNGFEFEFDRQGQVSFVVGADVDESDAA